MIDIKFDISELNKAERFLAVLSERNITFAVSKAMNASASFAREQLVDELRDKIDRPTRWTLGGTFASFAKANNLETTIGLRTDPQASGNPAGRYLMPLITGTRPRLKGADLSATKISNGQSNAVLIPARSAGLLDSYGNVPLRTQTQILSGLRAGRGYYVAPVRKGSTTKAIFETSSGFLGRTSTLVSSRRRVFTIDPNPKTRQPTIRVQQTLADAFRRRWNTELQTAMEQELRRKLGL